MTNPWIFHATRSGVWDRYLGTPAHRYMAESDAEYILHLRLTHGEHNSPWNMGIVLARSRRQGDFSDDDVLLCMQLLPSLQAAARRCRRCHTVTQERAVLETLIEESGLSPRLALDRTGRVLWRSAQAAAWLGDRVPRALEDAVRRLGAVAAGDGAASPGGLTVRLSAVDGVVLRGHLRIVRRAEGEPCVVVELEAEGPEATVAAVGARFGLTQAEIEVLSQLASGRRDREIAKLRFTSECTVRSHVTQIFGKLGVRSRLEAALVAHGVHVDPIGDYDLE